MKIAIWTLVFLAAATPAVMYLIQRWRQRIAERDGVAVYAVVVSTAPVRRFGKDLPMSKIVLWVQDPAGGSREVSITGRVEANQVPQAGSRLPIVIDPKNPKRVYPAGPDALKRIELTGPRRERRAMQAMTGQQAGGRAFRGQRQAPPARGPMPPPRGRRG